jgi:hypothetical protein
MNKLSENLLRKNIFRFNFTFFSYHLYYFYCWYFDHYFLEVIEVSQVSLVDHYLLVLIYPDLKDN